MSSTSEIVAATDAMRQKHQELIAQPLSMIWVQIARAGIEAAERMREQERQRQHELLPFLALWAAQYQRDYKLNGLHPVHYALMKKYGARMDGFQMATDSQPVASPQSGEPI